jgi:hypothetical protein
MSAVRGARATNREASEAAMFRGIEPGPRGRRQIPERLQNVMFRQSVPPGVSTRKAGAAGPFTPRSSAALLEVAAHHESSRRSQPRSTLRLATRQTAQPSGDGIDLAW